MKPTINHARKVVEVVGHGLSHGLGEPKPGEMCVEAAVCFALGLEHGDNPPCVASDVRDFKIELNDSEWSSDKARGRGMLKLAVAQLGSDRMKGDFGGRLALRVMQRLCPVLFRAQARNAARAGRTREAAAMRKAAELCADVENLDEGGDFLQAALNDARREWIHGSFYIALETVRELADHEGSSNALGVADHYAKTLKNPRATDKALRLLADIALDVLVELKSPGCKWLWLCE